MAAEVLEPFVCAAGAGMSAALAVHPIDLVKVHLQLAGQANPHARPTFFGVARSVVANEGFFGAGHALTRSLPDFTATTRVVLIIPHRSPSFPPSLTRLIDRPTLCTCHSRSLLRTQRGVWAPADLRHQPHGSLSHGVGPHRGVSPRPRPLREAADLPEDRGKPQPP